MDAGGAGGARGRAPGVAVGVAAGSLRSLDGFIAGPNGETDWIVPDPGVDFATIYAGFDIALLGRRTYELTLQPGAPPWPRDWDIYVVSRTLRSADNPAVRIIGTDLESVVRSLRASAGRDIWLFGGGELAASLLAMSLVDAIEVAIMPVVLGGGVPFIAPEPRRAPLRLSRVEHPATGIINVQYDVLHSEKR